MFNIVLSSIFYFSLIFLEVQLFLLMVLIVKETCCRDWLNRKPKMITLIYYLCLKIHLTRLLLIIIKELKILLKVMMSPAQFVMKNSATKKWCFNVGTLHAVNVRMLLPLWCFFYANMNNSEIFILDNFKKWILVTEDKRVSN